MENMKKGITILEATPEHEADIARLYNSISYDVSVDIRFMRGAHPYHSLMTDGQDAVIILIQDNAGGEIIGMGACCIHEMYIDGLKKKVGYLNGLKRLPEFSGKTRGMLYGFAEMGKRLQDRVDLCIGTIISNEEKTVQFFEKRRRNLPAYVKQDQYHLYCFAPSKKHKEMDLQKNCPEAATAFYKKWAPDWNLRTCSFIKGTSPEDAIVWLNKGKVKALCCLHDTREYKNYHLKAYNGSMRIIRHLLTRLLGYPAFPEAGRDVNAAAMSMLLFDPDTTTEERRIFIREASSFAAKNAIIMAGVTESDPTHPAFEKMKALSFKSHLYTINWGHEQMINNRPIYIDNALL